MIHKLITLIVKPEFRRKLSKEQNKEVDAWLKKASALVNEEMEKQIQHPLTYSPIDNVIKCDSEASVLNGKIDIENCDS